MISIFKKFWHGETKSLTAAAVIVGTASLASRVVGVLRDRVLAATFGAGHDLDAYYAAFRVPDFLYNLIILGALSAGFIPIFTEYLHKKTRDQAWELAGRVLSVVAFSMGIACLALSIFAPVLVPWTVPGFTPEQTDVVVRLSRIMFLSPFLLGMSAVMGGILQAMRRFVAFALAPVFYNLGIILGAVFLVPRMGIVGVAWGVVLGACLHLLVQAVVVIKLGLRRLPAPSLAHAGARRILWLMLPRTAGLAISQLNLVILLVFASTLSVGSVAIMNLASNLQAFPVGIIGISYAVAIFPLLSRAAADKNRAEFINGLIFASRKILFMILPITAIFYLLRPQIVRMLLGAGQFDWDDTIRTASVLAIFLLSLLPQCFVAVFARAFYALQDTKTPLMVGVIAEAVNIGVAAVSYKAFGIMGLASAFVASNLVNAILLWFMLRRRYGSLDEHKLISPALKSLAASAAIIMVGYPVRQFMGTMFPLRTFLAVMMQAGVTSIAALAAFLLVSWLLKSQELLEMKEVLDRKLFRSRPEVSGAEEAQGI